MLPGGGDPDPTKHCLCTGDKVMRYRTDNRGRTRLVCKKCGKPDPSEDEIKFQFESPPA